MLYALLCYDSEEVVGAWSKEQDDGSHGQAGRGRTTAGPRGQARPGRPPDADHRRDDAAQARQEPQPGGGDEPPLVLDGPFAETKEQLLGFFIVDCANLEEALATARELGQAEQPRRGLRDPSDLAVLARHVRHGRQGTG